MCLSAPQRGYSGHNVCPFVNRVKWQKNSLTRPKQPAMLHYEACAHLTLYKHPYIFCSIQLSFIGAQSRDKANKLSFSIYIKYKRYLGMKRCIENKRLSFNLLSPLIYIKYKRYFVTNRSIRFNVCSFYFSPIGNYIHLHSKVCLCNKLLGYLSTGLRVIYLPCKLCLISRNKSPPQFKLVVPK